MIKKNIAAQQLANKKWSKIGKKKRKEISKKMNDAKRAKKLSPVKDLRTHGEGLY